MIRSLVAAFTLVGMIVTGVLFTRPVLISDPPPWASKTTLEMATKTLQDTENRNHDGLVALMLEGQIRTMWGSRCNAVATRNMIAARSFDGELSQLQVRYRLLMGFEYPLGQCL